MREVLVVGPRPLESRLTGLPGPTRSEREKPPFDAMHLVTLTGGATGLVGAIRRRVARRAPGGRC